MARLDQVVPFEGYVVKPGQPPISFAGEYNLNTKKAVIQGSCGFKLPPERYQGKIFPDGLDFTNVSSDLKKDCDQFVQKYFSRSYEKRYISSSVMTRKRETLDIFFGSVIETEPNFNDENAD